MTVAGIGVIVSTLGLRRETHRVQIWDEVGGAGSLPDQRARAVIQTI
jgi:hypothetical protein